MGEVQDQVQVQFISHYLAKILHWKKYSCIMVKLLYSFPQILWFITMYLDLVGLLENTENWFFNFLTWNSKGGIKWAMSGHWAMP
jgi:hypothetical protein